MAVGIGGAPPRALANVFAGLARVAPGAVAFAMSIGCAGFTAALTVALTTTGAHADEAAAAAQIFAVEYPEGTWVPTPGEIAAVARSFRASPQYQAGLRICVNNMVNAIIAHTITDANTAAYCDAFATGYVAVQNEQAAHRFLDAARRLLDEDAVEAPKGK